MKPNSNKSSAKNAAWQVKGVTPETREAIKQAARKSGMTIGRWVNDTLHREAMAELTGKTDNLPMDTLENQFAEINAKLDRLEKPFWKRMFGGAS